MITITFRRGKCIGCNYCVETAPERWVMSRKDGKCNLVGGKEKKGYFTARVHNSEEKTNRKAAEACPVKIIVVNPC